MWTRAATTAVVSTVLLGAAFMPSLPLMATADAGGASASIAKGSVGYTLFRNSDHTIVRWDPCTEIQYSVNIDQTSQSALQDVHQAIGIISRASGLKFRYTGLTSEIPQRDFGAKMPAGSPPRLVVAWALPGSGSGRSDLLSDDEQQVGYGGWRTQWWREGDKDHPPRITSGYVVMNSANGSALLPGFDEGPSRGAVLLHELGHAVGLDHVRDRAQLMYSGIGTNSKLGEGDAAGLQRVGRKAGCLP